MKKFKLFFCKKFKLIIIISGYCCPALHYKAFSINNI